MIAKGAQSGKAHPPTNSSYLDSVLKFAQFQRRAERLPALGKGPGAAQRPPRTRLLGQRFRLSVDCGGRKDGLCGAEEPVGIVESRRVFKSSEALLKTSTPSTRTSPSTCRACIFGLSLSVFRGATKQFSTRKAGYGWSVRCTL